MHRLTWSTGRPGETIGVYACSPVHAFSYVHASSHLVRRQARRDDRRLCMLPCACILLCACIVSPGPPAGQARRSVSMHAPLCMHSPMCMHRLTWSTGRPGETIGVYACSPVHAFSYVHASSHLVHRQARRDDRCLCMLPCAC